MGCAHYEACALREDDLLTDLVVRLKDTDERTLHCWGRGGPDQERRLAASVPPDSLPVLLGSGLGICLDELSRSGPVAVVDRESPLLEASGVRRKFGGHDDVLWLDGDAQNVYSALDSWQQAQGLPLHILRIPFYVRLDPGYYRALAEALAPLAVRNRTNNAAHSALPVWARHPRFVEVRPRILILRKRYFLYAEIEAALQRLAVPHAFVDVGEGERMRPAFMEDLLRTVADFRPDFLLTVNHFGLDREGRLAGLLEDAHLPLASWFVDNPYLILHGWSGQSRPNIALFSFDADSLGTLRSQGFGHVGYLPLATDPERFLPGAVCRKEWRSPVSFVGESLTDRVQGLSTCLGDGVLVAALAEAGISFARVGDRSVYAYLAREYPHLAARLALMEPAVQLVAESLVTFTAARHARLECVRRLAPHPTLVAGDEHWPELLAGSTFRFSSRLAYYSDLPGFYASADVNFNCTSAQMKGAVNQRVFDVPACGAFLLTDEQEQLARLFEPGREVACYASPEEIPEMVGRWRGDAKGRTLLAARARKRVLAEHTYELRLATLLAEMRSSFG